MPQAHQTRQQGPADLRAHATGVDRVDILADGGAEGVELRALALWKQGKREEAVRILEGWVAQARRGRPARRSADTLAGPTVPSQARRPRIFRLGSAACIALAAAYAGMFALAVLVEPQIREIAIVIPSERLLP
jgi:hypothetical protein